MACYYFPRQLVQMTSPFAAIDAIFNRPRDAAAILFLIEDSGYMVPLWQHLRDSYLPSILAATSGANPSAPVSPLTPPPLSPLPIISFQTEALWMIASGHSPFEPQFDPSARRTPRWDDVPAINFNTRSGSTISPVNVTRAIEVRRARFHRLHALTRDLPLGVVRGIWSWSRNTPSCHYRDPKPPGGRTGSTWNSCVVHRGGTTAPSV